MPGSGGLSIATNVASAVVQQNLDRNQRALQTEVTRLSSGLRITSAADDPSGLAVAETLQAHVAGFDQGRRNVQDAQNAAAVADGALQTTTDILQRIRSLAVEASSDITSASDKANLQVEVSALLAEVDRIAQNTQFNGTALLDGSHAGFQPQQSAFLTIESNAVLATVGGAGGGGGATGTQTFGDFVIPAGNTSASESLNGLTAGESYTLTLDGTATGPGLSTYSLDVNGAVFANYAGAGTGVAIPASTTFVATGFDTLTDTAYNDPSNASTLTNITVAPAVAAPPAGANSGLLIACAAAANANFATTVGTAANGLAGVQGYTAASSAAGYTVDGTIELQVVNTGASIAVQEAFFNSVDTSANPVSVASQLLAGNQTATLFDNVAITTGNITTADVGLTAYLKISQNVAASSNPTQAALGIQSGADEGDAVAFGIAAVSAQSLRVANINLLLSAASIPSLGAEDAIGQIDNALQRLLTQRAQLGALITRLGEDADNDATASTNLQASESQVRDLDIGSASTDFTRLQILVQTGTTILQASNTNAQSVLRLFG